MSASAGRLAALTRTITGRRTKYVVLLAIIGFLALAGPLAGKVQDVEDNGPTSALPRGADSTLVEEELPSFNASGVLPVVVVLERADGLTDPDREWIEGLQADVAPWAASPATMEEAPDGAAVTVTYMIDTLGDEEWPDRIDQTRELLEAAPGGLASHVTGPAAGAYDGFSAFDGLDTTILLTSVLVVAILLLLTYRSPVLWMLPLACVGVAMALSQAVIYLLARHADLPVDGASGGLLPILVFGVGTDYALLLVSRYREQLRVVGDRHAAMAVALRRSAPAVVASAVTVVLALCCLMLADLNSTRSLGAVGAVGIGLAAVVMLTLLPVLLALFGRWAFWPFVPHPAQDDREAHRSVRAARRWGRVAGLVSRAPRRTWAATAGALGILAVTVVGLDLGPHDAERFRDAPDSVLGQRVLGEHFPAGVSTPVEIVADTAGLEAVRKVVAGVPGVERVSPGPTSVDGSRSLLSATLAAPPDSAEAREAVREVRRNLDAVPAASAIVGGWTAQQVDLRASSLRDAIVVMPTALVVVGLVLVLLLRAVLGPLVLLATVVLSYLAALGLHGLVMEAMGFDAVELGLPLLAFCFLVPLGVDYTIFLMSRVREEVSTHGHRDGVLRGLVATGGVITSAGIVLAATFGVLWQMPLTFMVGIGVVVSLGILLDTFVTRSLLVPALSVDLGPRFWWPGPVPAHDQALSRELAGAGDSSRRTSR